MDDIPLEEIEQFEASQRLARATHEMMESMGWQFGLAEDIAILIEADRRWQMGENDNRPIKALLRIARRIGIEQLVAIHRMFSPYAASSYTINFGRRDRSRPPKHDDRTPRRYLNERDNAKRIATRYRQQDARRLGLRTNDIRSYFSTHTEALKAAARDVFPDKHYSIRMLRDLYKQFLDDNSKAGFVASWGFPGFGPVGRPDHSIEATKPKVGRPPAARNVAEQAERK